MNVRLPLGTVSAALIGLAGCGDAQFASELPSKPTAVPISDVSGRKRSLPQDERFSIAVAPSSRHPGLGGTADAHGKASDNGEAELSAMVNNGGTAIANFQLGHAFKNDTRQQMDLDLVVRFNYEFSVTSSPSDRSVDAGVGLKLYARNSRNVLVRRDDLFSHAADRGPAARSGSDEVRLTVTVGPGESISVFLAGQTAVNAEYGRSATCQLSVKGMKMDVSPKAAPPVRSSG